MPCFPFPSAILADVRHATGGTLERMRDDLEWFGLLGDDAGRVPLEPVVGDDFEHDATWNLTLAGRVGVTTWRGLRLTLLDARGASPDVALAAAAFLSEEGDGQPRALLLDGGCLGWAEWLAALREGSPWAMACQPLALGRGGTAELAAGAFGLARPLGPGEAAWAVAQPATGPMLGWPGGYAMVNVEAGQVAIGRGMPVCLAAGALSPPVVELLMPHKPTRLPEPSPGGDVLQPAHAAAAPMSERTCRIPGKAGMWKLSAEVTGEEWCLMQWEDEDAAVVGLTAAGPAIGRATCAMRVARPADRPGVLTVRMLAGSRALRQGRAAHALRRAWMSYLGGGWQRATVLAAGGTEGAAPAAVRWASGHEATEEMELHLRAAVRADSQPGLEVEFGDLSHPARVRLPPQAVVRRLAGEAVGSGVEIVQNGSRAAVLRAATPNLHLMRDDMGDWLLHGLSVQPATGRAGFRIELAN